MRRRTPRIEYFWRRTLAMPSWLFERAVDGMEKYRSRNVCGVPGGQDIRLERYRRVTLQDRKSLFGKEGWESVSVCV